MAVTGACGQSLRDSVRKIYTAEIGVREASGRNDGPRVEEYLRSVKLDKGYAWCAAFICWTYRQAGIVSPCSAWSPDWFKKNVIYTRGATGNQMPYTADVFGIWFSDKGRIAHVGFIDEWQEYTSQTVTVEGNTNSAGSREGDGVYRKRRLKSQIYKVSRYTEVFKQADAVFRNNKPN